VLLETCHLFRNLAAHKDFKRELLIEAVLYEVWFALTYPKYLVAPTKFYNLLTTFNIRPPKATDFDVFRMVLGIEGASSFPSICCVSLSCSIIAARLTIV
jgi:hypothetical protein